MNGFDDYLRAALLVQGGGEYALRGWNGKLKQKGRWKNGATTVGRNTMLDNMFRTPTSRSWYQSLINNSGFSALSAADTSASHAGWTELHAVYSNATRPAWSPGAASSALISAAGTQFTFTSGGTAYGCFIISENTKGGTTGILWATGPFDTVLTVANLDTLDLTYATSLSAI